MKNEFITESEVSEKIAEDVRAGMDKQQKEFLLRQQLAASRKERGEDEPEGADDYRSRIDEADLPRVFDVAYRGSNSRVPRSDSSLPSGSGLGLAIAAGLVQAHRGTLTARNLPTGARFEVRLPLAE